MKDIKDNDGEEDNNDTNGDKNDDDNSGDDSDGNKDALVLTSFLRRDDVQVGPQ